jgi:hypothetical protein
VQQPFHLKVANKHSLAHRKNVNARIDLQIPPFRKAAKNKSHIVAAAAAAATSMVVVVLVAVVVVVVVVVMVVVVVVVVVEVAVVRSGGGDGSSGRQRFFNYTFHYRCMNQRGGDLHKSRGRPRAIITIALVSRAAHAIAEEPSRPSGPNCSRILFFGPASSSLGMRFQFRVRDPNVEKSSI